MPAARTTWIIGTRRTYAFAQYPARQIQQAVPTIRLVPAGRATLSEAFAAVTAQDCFIALDSR